MCAYAACQRCVYSHAACVYIARSVLITFRCSALEKAALSEQAARCGLSTSEYCRSLSLGG
ncbi:plasmid mobilization protein, partial [Phocaeicola vulgatus]|uniref:plasmid mobilization protein n=1 Tax=Phocaeicola vulgatus TaxID=821 RepID=UPI0039B47578